MLKPEKCPKCGAGEDEITNVQEMCDAIGVSKESQTDKDWMCTSCSEFFNCDEGELTSWYKDKDFSKMTISELSDVIFSDWRDISPLAFPYADAMRDLEDINDTYGADSASSVVSYFLSNAKSWKTDTAKKVKKTLQEMLA